MRGKTFIAAALAACALVIGGSAIATAAGGGPFGIGGDRAEQEAELAKELASKLGNGVSADQVKTALVEVRTERHAARRKQEAAALAAELDGVSAAKIEAALEKLHANVERAFRAGKRPERRDMAAALGKEIGKSAAEVRKAMRAAHQKRLKADLAAAVKDGRLTQKQADQIEKRMKSAPRGFRGHGPGGRGGGPGHVGPGPGVPGGADFAIPVPPPGR